MASLTKKTFGNRTYWYLRETARVEGRPKVVRTRYLGRAEDIEAAFRAAYVPTQVESVAFGEVAALLRLARRLGLREAIDREAPKRGQGLSVGQMLELCILSRACAPCSKRQLANWYEASALPRLLGYPARALSSQRLFDAMGYLGEAELARIEETVAARAAAEFALSSDTLLFDTTNFATYVDSETPAELPRRGHSKTHRHDLRLVGLALLLSRAEQIPLLSSPYPGNQPDVVTFSKLLGRLWARSAAVLPGERELTLIFDKGMNSARNLALLAGTPFHFVGSLSLYRHPRFFSLRQGPAETHPSLSGITAFRGQDHLFGRDLTLVLLASEEFRAQQYRGFLQTLARAERQLAPLTRPRVRTQTIERRLPEILLARHLREVLVVASEREGRRLTFGRDEAALERLRTEVFGYTLLMTDRHDLATPEIVAAYRSQAQIERAFRQMKDPELVAFTPMWHWTDQKIRVHAFCCVMALLLLRLLTLEAKRLGLGLDTPALLDKLAGVRECTLLYPAPGPGRPRVVRTLTRLDAEQQQLLSGLGLHDLAP